MTETTNDPAPVVRAAYTRRPPDEAFTVFTDEIGAWWPLPTHGLFGPEAGEVAFRDGHLIEQATDGREAIWGEVLAWDPPHRLLLTWHPGREADDASEIEVLFIADGDGTRVVLEHRGWERFGADGLARRRSYVGPNAWGWVLDHFADGAEPLSVADTEPLVEAYAAFFATAEEGGFGPPTVGAWSAEEVVAHVALNDLAMTAVCQALVHGRPPMFGNEVCQRPEVLARWIKACGDLDGLVARGRRVATVATAAIRRLSAEQLATPVACRLLHEGQVVLEDEMPWSVIAVDTQTGRHLPAHIEQLTDLRATVD
ncbi:MAG: SRPBCC domain-containing protein [Actinomycetota bacterium]